MEISFIITLCVSIISLLILLVVFLSYLLFCGKMRNQELLWLQEKTDRFLLDIRRRQSAVSFFSQALFRNPTSLSTELLFLSNLNALERCIERQENEHPLISQRKTKKVNIGDICENVCEYVSRFSAIKEVMIEKKIEQDEHCLLVSPEEFELTLETIFFNTLLCASKGSIIEFGTRRIKNNILFKFKCLANNDSEDKDFGIEESLRFNRPLQFARINGGTFNILEKRPYVILVLILPLAENRSCDEELVKSKAVSSEMVTKNIPKDQRCVLAGGKWDSHKKIRINWNKLRVQKVYLVKKEFYSDSNMTDREIHVADMMLSGKMNKEIALSLSTTEKAVDHIVSHIFRKVGVNRRPEFINMIYRRLFGVFPLSEDC